MPEISWLSLQLTYKTANELCVVNRAEIRKRSVFDSDPVSGKFDCRFGGIPNFDEIFCLRGSHN